MIGLGLSIPMVAVRYSGTSGEVPWFENMPGLDFTVGRISVNPLQDPSLLPTSGSIAKSATVNRVDLNTEGAVLEDYDLRGWNAQFKANNCIIRNCLFDDANVITASVRADAAISGCLVENCTFDQEKSGANLPVAIWLRGNSHTVRNNYITGISADGISMVGGLVENNYVYGVAYAPSAHSDAIYFAASAAPITVTHNVINMLGDGDQPPPDPGDGPNNTVRVTDEGGTNTQGTIITQNILLYGANSMQVFTNCEDVEVTDNRFADYAFGALHPSYPASIVWTNNVNHNTGVTIPLP